MVQFLRYLKKQLYEKNIYYFAPYDLCLSPSGAVNKVDQLQALEQNQPSNQNVTHNSHIKISSRLFGTKDDLTSVILIIPADSVVAVLGSDSTYLHVAFEDNEGYIFKRQAVIDKIPVRISANMQSQQPVQETQPAQEQQESRFSYLENKYGSSMAARLIIREDLERNEF